jgi:DNA-binding response OmpR family regulator
MSPSHTVAFIGNECELRDALRVRLECDGITFDAFATPATCVDTLREKERGVVVLQLAGYRAVEDVQWVRALTKAPVIALTDATVDGVDALEAGADDYVRLPCTPREIAARARSVLRRRSWDTGHAETLQFGDLAISAPAHEVRLSGRVIPVPRREFELLRHLAASPGRVFSRLELLESVWGASPDWLGPATVTEHVRRLRMRLHDAKCERPLIHTVRGAGYRFQPPERGEARTVLNDEARRSDRREAVG